MLSILIPTYNYNCYPLVEELWQQAKELNAPFEIIVADDASREEMKIDNRQINKLSNCRYLELEKNIGRACIRNLLGEEAQYKYLLFLDSDAGIKEKLFLRKYLEVAPSADVVCGGLLHPSSPISASSTLRYRYEKNADKRRNVSYRREFPYKQFTAFNLLIKKEVFLAIKFDESFVLYGHEDTVLGAELKRRSIPILHIDNALYHLGLESNEIFLRKTEISIANLICEKDKLKKSSRLYLNYSSLCNKGMKPFIMLSFKLFSKALRKNLLGTHPNMKLFALYKLGYLCSIDHCSKK
ncbi:MAG: glycosyltransferase [Bacteroides sp.]